MKLDAYLKRLRYSGPLTPDLETLNALHEAHAHAVPFENYDVYTRRPVHYGLDAAYEQIVALGQGGWCYELNTLFGWALSEIGFDVTRLSAGVRRARLGDAALGNHLCLNVHLDQDYLVDVGFRSSQIRAIAMSEGVTNHKPFQIALSPMPDGYWRFHEGGIGSATSFDFLNVSADEALLRRQHQAQIEDANGIFRKTLLAKIRQDDRHYTLRGCHLTIEHNGRTQTQILEDAEALNSTLVTVFGLQFPNLEARWPDILARHKQLFPHAARR